MGGRVSCRCMSSSCAWRAAAEVKTIRQAWAGTKVDAEFLADGIVCQMKGVVVTFSLHMGLDGGSGRIVGLTAPMGGSCGEGWDRRQLRRPCYARPMWS